MGAWPCRAGGTAKPSLCFLPRRSTGVQRATQRFVPSTLAFLSSTRGKEPPFTDLTAGWKRSRGVLPLLGSCCPLRKPHTPQDEILELLRGQDHRLQRLPGAAGLQHGAALLDGEGGKGAAGEVIEQSASGKTLTGTRGYSFPCSALMRISIFNSANFHNCSQMIASGFER